MKPADILKNFKHTRILVLGDIILDRYIWGKVNRISPEAPVPVVEVTEDNFMLGGAANVANNIISLGGEVTVAGISGNDRAGEVLRRLLEEKEIICALFEDPKRPTTIKTRVIAHNQQVVRFDREDRNAISGSTMRDLMIFLKRAVPEYDAIIVSDYEKGVISRKLIEEILKIKPKQKLLAVDPKVGHFHYYKGVSIITPNLMEASRGSGIDIKDEKSLIRAGKALLNKLSCSAVLITRGEEGMSLFEKGSVTHIPTAARHVYDVTGAGDTVIAVFSLVYAAGGTMRDAAIIANHAAGIVVGEVGTATATPEKLLESLKTVTSNK